MDLEIRDTLTGYRRYLAELHLLEADIAESSQHSSLETQNRSSFLKQQVKHVNAWMTLLSDDERFVVENHLMAGIDIPRIVILYQERWGREFAKSGRTIKGYQKHALQKIVAFEKQMLSLKEPIPNTLPPWSEHKSSVREQTALILQ